MKNEIIVKRDLYVAGDITCPYTAASLPQTPQSAPAPSSSPSPAVLP